jgi:hypothetical protein
MPITVTAVDDEHVIVSYSGSLRDLQTYLTYAAGVLAGLWLGYCLMKGSLRGHS